MVGSVARWQLWLWRCLWRLAVALVWAGCCLWPLLSGPVRQQPVQRGVHSLCRPDFQVNALPPMAGNYTEMLMDLFNYLSKPHRSACRKKMRFGGQVPFVPVNFRVPILDGHKFVCADAGFTLLTSPSCLVYSIGMSVDWSFDEDIGELGCSVYGFDPSINVTTGNHDGVMFYHYGIGSTNQRDPDQGWEVRTLDLVVNRLRHSNRTIQYLKMDIENMEWEVLQQQVALGSSSVLFRNVEQLGLEVHLMMNPQEEKQWYRHQYRTLLGLQGLGFYPMTYDPNQQTAGYWDVPGMPGRIPWAFEVVWIKTSCVMNARGRIMTRGEQAL